MASPGVGNAHPLFLLLAPLAPMCVKYLKVGTTWDLYINRIVFNFPSAEFYDELNISMKPI